MERRRAPTASPVHSPQPSPSSSPPLSPSPANSKAARLANFSGAWHVDRARSEPMEPVLALMGVPWVVRRVVDRLDVVTAIAHAPAGLAAGGGAVRTTERTAVGKIA